MEVSRELQDRVLLINNKHFDVAHQNMPTTIAKAVAVGAPMVMISQACDGLLAQIEYEIIQLTAKVNIDQRLTIQAHQVPVIAQELYDEFKSESIEDIAVCLKRGAIGIYGDIYRLDGAVIAGWMRKYLDEKYDVLVANLNAEKENFYQVKKSDKPEEQLRPERNLLSLLEVVNGQKPIPAEVAKHLTEEQIKEIQFYQNTNGIIAHHPNDYFQEKLKLQKAKREKQDKLNRASSEFYAKKESYSELKTWEDDKGFYVMAETSEDADEIYKSVIQ
jgi:hypothetical protein